MPDSSGMPYSLTAHANSAHRIHSANRPRNQMTARNYDLLKARLAGEPQTWLITGVAGFIGSNLLETLLTLNQRVVGLDNFATGYQSNLDEVRELVSAGQWARFRF